MMQSKIRKKKKLKNPRIWRRRSRLMRMLKNNLRKKLNQKTSNLHSPNNPIQNNSHK
jgi:hypothetical protein